MNRLTIRELTDSYGSLVCENTFNVFLNMAVLPNYFSTYPTCNTVPPTEYDKNTNWLSSSGDFFDEILSRF
jgi:hypothetical protein